MTTPSFFDDLAKKCAKTKFDAENLRREERASFKSLLTEQWEKMKPILAEQAVKDGISKWFMVYLQGVRWLFFSDLEKNYAFGA